MIQGTANLRATHRIVTTDWDPPDAEVAQVSRQLIDETVAAWNAQHADLERARAIAVALEQENAELRRLMDAGYVYIRGTREIPPAYDVVGQEGLPLGAPWGESPIPEDWREEE